MRIKAKSAIAVLVAVLSALIITVAGSPAAAAELVPGATASPAAHAAKKAHTKKAHKTKKHKKHKKKLKCKTGYVKKNGKCVKTPRKSTATQGATTEKGGTKTIASPSEIPLAPAWTAAQLNAYPSGNWIDSEGGTTGDHFSKLKEITPANVSAAEGRLDDAARQQR